MRTVLKIGKIHNSKDENKLIKVIELMNSLKATNIHLVSVNKNAYEIEYSEPGELFVLGRFFEPYKPPEGGSIKLNFNNDFVYSI